MASTANRRESYVSLCPTGRDFILVNSLPPGKHRLYHGSLEGSSQSAGSQKRRGWPAEAVRVTEMAAQACMLTCMRAHGPSIYWPTAHQYFGCRCRKRVAGNEQGMKVEKLQLHNTKVGVRLITADRPCRRCTQVLSFSICQIHP